MPQVKVQPVMVLDINKFRKTDTPRVQETDEVRLQ